MPAWAIMDTDTLTKVINSSDPAVINVLTDVANNFSSFDASWYSIISESGAQNEQEFMVASAPEPASFALLGGGLLAAGLARLSRRRKLAV
ncbi:MAG: PEP-CTERM sorting domain-containing protein [Acidobacteriota bacterium]|nr:PEP-CTERM sorting domain-containing protein [Acidobacteriota bacterium]